MQRIAIDGSHLTIDEIIAVARHGAEVQLAPEAYEVIQTSYKWVADIIDRSKV